MMKIRDMRTEDWSGPATPRQREMLREMGLSPLGWSVADAARAINTAYARRRAREAAVQEALT